MSAEPDCRGLAAKAKFMLIKIIGATLLVFLLNFMFPSFVFSQSKEDQNAKKYKARIIKRGTGGKPIVVKLRDKSKSNGVINDIKDDYFVLKESKSGSLLNIYYNQIEDIDKAFSNTEKTIAIIGAGFGATLIVVCFIARKCVD